MTPDELLQDIDTLDLIAGRVAVGLELHPNDPLARDLIESVIRKLEEALNPMEDAA